tara:strand:- start:11333 stop:12061 length:729 start_codon:yes stop_codon:yes gene_type:complete
MKNGVLLCCHGSRSNVGINDTKKLLKTLKKNNKSLLTKIGYLEITKPSIKDQLEFFFKKNINSLIIVPVMIFSGNHTTKDIPKILRVIKKKYKNSPQVFITKPLIFANDFFNTVQRNLKKKIKKNVGLITVSSNTINPKAKNQIRLLTKKLSKKNSFMFHKSILINLNKEKLKRELINVCNKNNKLLVLPFFLFRGKLLDNLIKTIKDLNKKDKSKFILCNHISNYKDIHNLIKNVSNNKLH